MEISDTIIKKEWGGYMSGPIKVCIADDNVQLANNLANYLSANKEIYVTKICEDGNSVIEALEENEFDILVIDIIMPKIDGIGVLEKIEELIKNGKMKKRPGIIIISAIMHDNIKFDIFNKGVNYYMTKPIELDIIEARIIEIYKGIQEPDGKLVEQEIKNILYKLEIYPNLLGYRYIKQCVEILLKKPYMQVDFRKKLYPIVAEENNQSVHKVERSIINAINIAWNKEKDRIAEFLNNKLYESKKPSTRIMLTSIAEEVKRKI